ncbi:hypothetical protein P4114_20110 [Pseudomonas aeruginosa]|nr:hypothetical protein [Pseudomonas aeruginosa]
MTAPRHRKESPGSTAAGAARPCQASEACTSGASACRAENSFEEGRASRGAGCRTQAAGQAEACGCAAEAGQQAGRQDKPAPAKRASSARLDPEVRKPLPSAKLDLRLPKELVQKMAPPGTEETHKPKPLLPPMFEEKDDSDFRLNGQLLYRDRELGVSRPLEGAELQFEFRQ